MLPNDYYKLDGIALAAYLINISLTISWFWYVKSNTHGWCHYSISIGTVFSLNAVVSANKIICYVEVVLGIVAEKSFQLMFCWTCCQLHQKVSKDFPTSIFSSFQCLEKPVRMFNKTSSKNFSMRSQRCENPLTINMLHQLNFVFQKPLLQDIQWLMSSS